MKQRLYAHEKIAENRYREIYGMCYEDFTIGDIFEHRPGRTITQVDNIWQSLLSMNIHPLHIDEHFASQTEFGKLLVSSAVTFSIINGMSVRTMSAKAIANLGWDEVRLPAPVYVGDTLYAQSEVINKRESKSRTTQGIITIETTGFNHHGATILLCKRHFLVPKKDYELTL